MNRSMVLLLLIVVLAGSIWGCGRMRQKKEKEHGVEYTVLGEDQIPDEIRKVVDVKKQEEFHISGRGYAVSVTGVWDSEQWRVQYPCGKSQRK